MKLVNKIQNSLDKLNIVKNAKKFFIGSAIVILAGILVVALAGFNLGIDFTGGTVININAGSEIETSATYNTYVEQIETVLEDNGLSLSLAQKEGEGETATIVIRFQDISGASEAEMATVTDQVKIDIATTLNLLEEDIQDSQRIGASATTSLLLNAFLALLIATVLILVYVAFRFEVLSGVSAIIALVHDILIMCSLVAIFQIEINSAFIAAVITIVGYSINDTIVVFDRVRENREKDIYKNETNAKVVNISVKETIVRTLNTSITTLFTITILAVLSVATIREFAIPIIFGLIAGTYSSIFIATPFWAIISDKSRKNNKPTKVKKLKTDKETLTV